MPVGFSNSHFEQRIGSLSPISAGRGVSIAGTRAKAKAGRGRLKSNISLRPAHPPRALILSTGEEKPSGESLIARMFLVEVVPGDIDPKRLSACQRDAASDLYAQATAGYIRWLAPRLEIRCARR
jgi:hypothetical protein